MSGILEAVIGAILFIIEETGYTGVFFLMVLESANIPVPSEIIMPFSGFLVSSGSFSFWPVALMGALGNLAGSLISYGFGYWARANINAWNQPRIQLKVERAKYWIARFGDYAAFFSRLLPVVRTFISFPIGFLGVQSLWRFSILTFLGSLLWCIPLTYLGFVLGENWRILEPYFRAFDVVIVLGILGALAYIIWEFWYTHGYNHGSKA